MPGLMTIQSTAHSCRSTTRSCLICCKIDMERSLWTLEKTSTPEYLSRARVNTLWPQLPIALLFWSVASSLESRDKLDRTFIHPARTPSSNFWSKPTDQTQKECFCEANSTFVIWRGLKKSTKKNPWAVSTYLNSKESISVWVALEKLSKHLHKEKASRIYRTGIQKSRDSYKTVLEETPGRL